MTALGNVYVSWESEKTNENTEINFKKLGGGGESKRNDWEVFGYFCGFSRGLWAVVYTRTLAVKT